MSGHCSIVAGIDGSPSSLQAVSWAAKERRVHLLAAEPGHAMVLGFIGRWWEKGYGRVE